MTVQIDIEMPIYCYDCPCHNGENGRCNITGDSTFDKRPFDCPLKEVKSKMDDLINRQEAIDAIRASTSKYTGFMGMEMYTDDDAVEAINDVPSAEPERKKGKWIVTDRDENCNCSECGKDPLSFVSGSEYWWVDTLPNFCPNCGANMRG